MLEEIIHYKTSDGTMFNTKEEAENHEIRWQWERKLKRCDHYVLGGLRGVGDLGDLVEFLDSNPWLLDLMGWEVKDKTDKIATEIVASKVDLLTYLTSRIKTHMLNSGLSEDTLAKKLSVMPVGVRNLNESQRWSIETVFDVSNKLNLQIGINVTNGSDE